MSTSSAAVAIVSTRPDGHGPTRLVQACAARGLHARAMHPSRLALAPATGALRLVVTRLPSGTPPPLLARPLAAERDGVPFLNRPTVLRTVHDKWDTLRLLARHGVPVPPTVCVERDGEVDLDALPGERFVLKPGTGAAGRGVTVGLDRDAARRCALAFADASAPVLVQPLLGDGTDRRMLLVAGALVAAMERRPGPGAAGRGSLLYGARGARWAPGPDQLAVARRVVELLGLDVAGIDLVHHAGRDVVLDVNACPGLAGIEAVTGIDVAGALAAEACRRIAGLEVR